MRDKVELRISYSIAIRVTINKEENKKSRVASSVYLPKEIIYEVFDYQKIAMKGKEYVP
jgi:hypothetical protein